LSLRESDRSHTFTLNEIDTTPCSFIDSDKAEAALESIRSSGEPGAIVIGAIKEGSGVEMQNLEQWST